MERAVKCAVAAVERGGESGWRGGTVGLGADVEEDVVAAARARRRASFQRVGEVLPWRGEPEGERSHRREGSVGARPDGEDADGGVNAVRRVTGAGDQNEVSGSANIGQLARKNVGQDLRAVGNAVAVLVEK